MQGGRDRRGLAGGDGRGRVGGFSTLPRSLSTPWIERWNAASAAELEAEAERLSGELVQAVREGRGHELVPFTGQSVGLVRDVPSAAEIVRKMVAGAAEALRSAGRSEGAAQQR